MELPSKYDPREVENKWYSYWLSNGHFRSIPDEREPYTIVIPPPNVTGHLHMGHMLNNTIQDVLIRRARMQGYNACWVPGTDHASIATEAKVVAMLKDKGIDKRKITREEFLDHAWEWKEKHGNIILEQLKKLGCSCDWQRTKFTMDEEMTAGVLQVFVDLYEKGLIYRSYRMVNWDPEAKTTLSDEEVFYEEKNSQLFFLAYPIENSDDRVVIATTRPETILGDTAICVHPEDERYLELVGKKAVIPISNRPIPIISDPYVDPDFGTGCLKITPAHDPNDWEIGLRHKLEVLDIFNDDGTLNKLGLHYEGKDRFQARNEIIKELNAKGYLVKKENYTHKVGLSERTKAVVEPKLSDQWFLKMDKLSKSALDAVIDTTIQIYPPKFISIYRHWMENIRDWNISRQLWWGQRIPAYYYGPGKDDYVVAVSMEVALLKAREKSGNVTLNVSDLRQDPDVLDTWFSSWLWPISVFDGIRHPTNEEIKYYYPTNDLVTAPDIIFFWVARMIIAGYEYRNEPPFTNVYFTGLVRDAQGRKMSKQLGNSPDALELIDRFGADGVRVGLLLSAPAGNDLLFDEALCEQGRNFGNKIWNAFRLIQGWQIETEALPNSTTSLALDWYSDRFMQALSEVDDHFSKYRISDALMAIYRLIWDDFCSWLLEIIKPKYGKKIDKESHERVLYLLECNLRILHPFMPFLTEEIWQSIKERKAKDALVVSSWPSKEKYDGTNIEEFEYIKLWISAIRAFRKDKKMNLKDKLDIYMLANEERTKKWDGIVADLVNLSSITYINSPKENTLSFRVGNNECFVPTGEVVNKEEERRKIQIELDYTIGFLNSVRKKLTNERFVSSAPEAVVNLEKKKEADALMKIDSLQRSLKSLD